ncbi:hypothetical protein ACFLS5_00640 [Candidatus Bipolaricaulota bacterium]
MRKPVRVALAVVILIMTGWGAAAAFSGFAGECTFWMAFDPDAGKFDEFDDFVLCQTATRSTS